MLNKGCSEWFGLPGDVEPDFCIKVAISSHASHFLVAIFDSLNSAKFFNQAVTNFKLFFGWVGGGGASFLIAEAAQQKKISYLQKQTTLLTYFGLLYNFFHNQGRKLVLYFGPGDNFRMQLILP